MKGTPFGRYSLLDLLGRGGMGEVWRAYDTETDRVVALKLLPPHLSEDEDFQQRFRREAHAAARLNSPHVIPIHNYGEIDGRLYVDMRLIDGRDLQAVLADGPIEPARAVRIIEHVALALHAAHRVGLVHRDVKPSNILLDDDDYGYLIDFGIARAADETRLTKSGNTIGSFQYIAPERLGSRTDEDERADIYSLACVLYECLTGEPPFAEDTMANLVVAQLMIPPPKPSVAQPNVPEQIDQVIATGMAKDPEQRYATTVELANAARDAITGPIERPTPNSASTLIEETPDVGQPARPTSTERAPARRRRRPWILAGAAAAVVLVAAAGTFAVVRHHDSQSVPTTPRAAPSRQVVLPFVGLNHPDSATADKAGNIYVADGLNDRVLKMAAGTTTQKELPFAGLNQPWDVAVDIPGNVYVSDHGNNRVLKLAVGAATQTELPFADLLAPWSVAVDVAGNVYVTDSFHNRVLKLPAGASTSIVLPSVGVSQPRGLAVDTAGNVYVTDSGDRVLKLPAGTDAWTVLPFSGLYQPEALGVDQAGAVYVADSGHNRVVKLAAGATAQTELPFTGLDYPDSVAVDTAGNVYITDWRNNRVLKLPAG